MRGEEWDVRLRGKKDGCAKKRAEQRNRREMWQRDSRDFFSVSGSTWCPKSKTTFFVGRNLNPITSFFLGRRE
jgi:hypothetical protein